MMKLYTAEMSGNAYKARLALSLLGLDYEPIEVNLSAGDNRTDAFLALNPRGQIPVLVDGDIVVWDSQAVLVYLARQYSQQSWLPTEAWPMAEVMQWMAVAENEVLFGLARARAVKLFNRPWNFDECKAYGHAGLTLIDNHLSQRDWLACAHLTIADIACYPYVALARAGELPLDDFGHIAKWMQRIEALPGYVAMPGITPQ